jgi:3',5'-cyclic AMP phosphodiesterase CpdA
MRRIAHISDLHFCRIEPAVADALVVELNIDRPDLIALSGDLTMRARSREYRAAQAFLARLHAPVLAVPGNHDLTSYWLHERFLDPLGRWRRFIAKEPEPVWTDDEIAVVGLNTTSRAAAFLDWSQGRVGQTRLRRAVERLQAMPPHLFRIAEVHAVAEDAVDVALRQRAARFVVAPSARNACTSLVQDSVSTKPWKIRRTSAASASFTTSFRSRTS